MLKPHAEKMLQECGIVDILRQHGEVLFHGSYATDLMVWPDIDVSLFNDGCSIGENIMPSMQIMGM